MIDLERVRERAEADAKTYGLFLNPNKHFLQDLLEGLKSNEERYNYPSCPCRYASGNLETDRDIICPCDYRDPDVLEYGTCYCGLYVKKNIFEGKATVQPVPERRPMEKQIRSYGVVSEATTSMESETPPKVRREPSTIRKRLWYCKQCGYVVFREDAPYVCPICKAKKEMFGEISFNIS